MTINQLLNWFLENQKQLQLQGLNIKKKSSNYYDPNYQESSQTYKFKIGDNSYELGHIYITEDHEDWAQAETYECPICNKDEQNYPPEKLYHILSNYKAELRDTKLTQLLHNPL
jgi:hypothetical protein